MTQDQVFVPKTRSQRNLPAFDPTREDITGEHVSKEVMAEMWEALEESPLIGALGRFVGLHMLATDLPLTILPSNPALRVAVVSFNQCYWSTPLPRLDQPLQAFLCHVRSSPARPDHPQ